MLKSISIILKRSGIVALGLMAFAAVSGSASAAVLITTDGVLKAEELASGLSTPNGSATAPGAITGVTGTASGAGNVFYDNQVSGVVFENLHGHDTIYTPAAGYEADVFWGASTDHLYLYIGVPLYAKNMIWQPGTFDSTNIDPTNTPNTNPDEGLTEEDYEPYLLHHNKNGGIENYKMDYGTATGSEDLVLNGGMSILGMSTFDLQDNLNGNTSEGSYANSLNWLLGNPAACGTTGGAQNSVTSKCTARNTAMSWEFKLDLAALETETDGTFSLIKGLQDNGVGFHISDEARLVNGGQNPVPVPAAFWLFGTAIVGLIGMRRKTKLAA